MHRVPEVIDVWYDSGAMPFAQWGAPHTQRAEFEASYPAQYICEAIDQTRGWFYTLMAIGTLVFDKSSYETVLCLGLLLDGEGRKMSKHLGNVLDPFELFDRHGADAVRWLMLAGGSPWMDRRIGHENVEEVVRKVLLTYYNTASFFLLYASTGDWTAGRRSGPAGRSTSSTAGRAASSPTPSPRSTPRSRTSTRRGPAGGSPRFLDDLSNWYVRRSPPPVLGRRPGGAGHAAPVPADGHPADGAAHPVPHRLALAAACASRERPDSVHLASLAARPTARDRRAAVGRRSSWCAGWSNSGALPAPAAKVKTRQPLARARCAPPLLSQLPDELRQRDGRRAQRACAVEPLDGELVDIVVKPNFRALGKRFGPRTKEVAAAVAEGGRAGRRPAHRRGRRRIDRAVRRTS